MIVVCSSCSTRYLVPDANIGTEGRTVRCANCGYEWFQELEQEEDALAYLPEDELPPEDEEIEEPEDALEEEPSPSEDEEIEDEPLLPEDIAFEDAAEGEAEQEGTEEDDEPETDSDSDIPDSIKPSETEDASPIDEGKTNLPAIPRQGLSRFMPHMVSYGLAAMLVLILAFGGIELGLFSFSNAPLPVDAEGLVFDRFHAKDNHGVLEITGHVVNMSEHEKALPNIKFSLVDEEGTAHHEWIVEAPKEHIAVEEKLPVAAQYEGDSSSLTSLQLTFVAPSIVLEDSHAEMEKEEHSGHEVQEEHEDLHAEPHAHAEPDTGAHDTVHH